MDIYISNTLEMFLVYILVFQIQKTGDEIINQHIVQKSVTKISPKMLLSGAVGGGKCPKPRSISRTSAPKPISSAKPANAWLRSCNVSFISALKPL